MIIGITGPNASGKGEACEHLKGQGFAYFSLSDIVREEATARGLDHNRESLIQVGQELRRESGPGVLAKRILERLADQDAVVDSIRHPAEVEILRGREDFILVAVDAPVEARFQREIRRKRGRVPQSLGEFVKLEELENTTDENAQQLRATMLLADRVITNDYTLPAFHRQFDQITTVRPSWDHYFMKIAMLVSERSTCLRHHVGAIITKDKRIITSGYNGAPAGARDSLQLGCLRDQMRIPSGTRAEICRATHAEQNAIIQSGLYGMTTEGGTMYCTHSPCYLCAKMVANARLKRFVTYKKYPDEMFGPLFQELGIEFVQIAKPETEIKTLD